MVVCVEGRNKGRDVIREEGEMRSGRPRNARWCALKRVGGEQRGTWMDGDDNEKEVQRLYMCERSRDVKRAN